jgi:hypothetical protein
MNSNEPRPPGDGHSCGILSEQFYNAVGREVSLARDSQRETHNWVITLVGGTFVAIAAFAQASQDSLLLGEATFLIALLLTPLVFRLFVRSCLEYQNFNRWISIRNALDAYYFARNYRPELADQARDNVIESVRLYYFRWKQPKGIGKMIWDNIQLAYGWPFILNALLLAYGVAKATMTLVIAIALIASGTWMAFEAINFVRYFACRHVRVRAPIDLHKL